MASRDRYELRLSCQNCGTRATAKVSDSDNSWSGADFQVDDLPASFVYSVQSRFPHEAGFACATCGAVADTH